MRELHLRSKAELTDVLAIVKKFGFISKNVFWDLFCPSGKTARYKYWNELYKTQFFTSYSFGSGVPEHLSLSQKGKQAVGQDAVTATAMTNLPHDEIVMRFYLYMLANDLLVRGWSEGELKADRALAIQTLGSGIISKLPDLVFDVHGGDGFIRCALEVERTRKSQRRYKTMRRAYSQTSKVDLLLVAVANSKIESVISNEFTSALGNSLGREFAFFDIDEFNSHRLRSTLRVAGKEATLESFFEILKSNRQKNAEKTRKDSVEI